MKRIKREGEKGAMGVGTLIVFIAMVLVAAVAASVLIDTANKLQQQAQKTGDQAVREVSTSFKVIDAYGWNGNDNTIGNISLKLGLASGSPAQSLNQTVIEIKTNESETSLVAVSSDTGLGTGADSNSYAIKGVMEQEGDKSSFSDVQYVEQGDIVNITLNLYEALGKEVGTQSDISIDIIPKHGTPGYVMLTTPPVINSKIVDLT
ncbi:MAG: archaellin/type IV pilin N-terminal domain-containing protein [Thermoplasmatota archaeon]